MKKLLCVLSTVLFCNIANAQNLIVYFSQSGTTQKLADAIHDVVGGDLVRIEPLNPYPTEQQELLDLAKQEQQDDARPAYKDLSVNMDEYDTVYVGYPIWYGKMPMIVYAFFDDNDLSGKTIMPFTTYGGSGESGTTAEIRLLEPDANVMDAFGVASSDVDNIQTDAIMQWVEQ